MRVQNGIHTPFSGSLNLDTAWFISHEYRHFSVYHRVLGKNTLQAYQFLGVNNIIAASIQMHTIYIPGKRSSGPKYAR